MKVRDLAKWMREEHEKVGDLIHLVRKHIAVPPRGDRARWIRESQICFRRLSEHLHTHMALEEEGGYMHEVLERRPTLEREVMQLKHEHMEMGQLMRQIQAALDELNAEDHLLVRDCCSRISTLLSYVERHKETENHLVLFVFTQDMGTKD